MWKIICLTFLLTFIFKANCQNNDLKLISFVKSIGHYNKKQTDIFSKQYTFSKNINYIYIDTTSYLMSIQLRGISPNGKWLSNNGSLLIYDVEQDSLLWSKKILYNGNFITQSDSLIAIIRNGRSYLFKNNSGVAEWKIKKSIIHLIQPRAEIGIALGSSGTYGVPEIQGVNLKNGKLVWRKEIASYDGWENLYQVNDSCVLVLSNGLRWINIKNGRGWHTVFENEVNKHKGQTVKTSMKVTMGLYTGFLLNRDLEQDKKNELIADSINIYYLSNTSIYCLSKTDGAILWCSTFKDNGTSSRTLIQNNENLYVINNNSNENLNDNIIALNKNNGKIKFIYKDLGGTIRDFTFFEGNLLVVTGKQAIHIDKNTAKVIMQSSIDIPDVGSIKKIVSSSLLYKEEGDSLFYNLKELYPQNILLNTSKNIVILDNKLSPIKVLDPSNLYYTLSKSNKFKLIKQIKSNNTWLFKENEGQILKIDLSKNAYLMDEVLYDWNENNLFVLNLKQYK
jgi:outer membrane protein assembly factor BamB